MAVISTVARRFWAWTCWLTGEGFINSVIALFFTVVALLFWWLINPSIFMYSMYCENASIKIFCKDLLMVKSVWLSEEVPLLISPEWTLCYRALHRIGGKAKTHLGCYMMQFFSPWIFQCRGVTCYWPILLFHSTTDLLNNLGLD